MSRRVGVPSGIAKWGEPIGEARPGAGCGRGDGELGGQVLGADRAVAGQDQGALDGVGKLADVARPFVRHQHLDRLGADRSLSVRPRREV